jgi:hypothetical protein
MDATIHVVPTTARIEPRPSEQFAEAIVARMLPGSQMHYRTVQSWA